MWRDALGDIRAGQDTPGFGEVIAAFYVLEPLLSVVAATLNWPEIAAACERIQSYEEHFEGICLTLELG